MNKFYLCSNLCNINIAPPLINCADFFNFYLDVGKIAFKIKQISHVTHSTYFQNVSFS